MACVWLTQDGGHIAIGKVEQLIDDSILVLLDAHVLEDGVDDLGIFRNRTRFLRLHFTDGSLVSATEDRTISVI